MLSAIAGMEKKYGLRCANVFHAGDGNLHPLIMYDAAKPGEWERAEAFGLDGQNPHRATSAARAPATSSRTISASASLAPSPARTCSRNAPMISSSLRCFTRSA